MNPNDLWFNTPDTNTLCRAGGNGPEHPSQLYALKKYLKPGMSMLDYGCGSATTLEALQKAGYHVMPEMLRDMAIYEGDVYYKGVDIIPKNIEWCKENFKGHDFEINKTLHRIDQPTESFDLVYSRHVVDHMESFEMALREHCRVARKLVIIVLWRPLGEGDEHEIKHIVDQGKVYEDEYTNDYSRSKVLAALAQKRLEGWETLEVAEGVGKEVKGFDVVICLQKF